MKFELPPLPYSKNALEPHMSRETVEYHYEKHHRGYLAKLQKAIEGKPEGEKSLEEIILGSEGSVFNNAAQVWNHTFFWNCMDPKGGGEPGGDELLHVLGLEALGPQTAMAHLVQLIGDQIQDVFAVGLGGVAAIAVVPAKLFEVMVQITHGRVPWG